MSQMKECNLCLSVKDIHNNFISKRGKETKSCSTCLYKKNQKKKDYRNRNKDKVKSSHQRYYLENAISIKERVNNYRKENKEKIKQRKKQLITCVCGSVYQKCSKAKHERTKKHQKWLDSINV